MRSPQLLATGSTSINMTPMIDVVFLLVIFFLVSSHLAKQENLLPLDLPNATSGLDELTERESVVVNVLSDGSWQIAGNSVNENQLLTTVKSRVQGASTPLTLRIRTDRSVTYDRIEPVLRAASQAGVGDIVFSVFEERS